MGSDRTDEGFKGREGGVCEVAIGCWCTGQCSGQGECSVNETTSNEIILGEMHTSFTTDAQKERFKQLVLVDFVLSLKVA